MKMWLLSRCEIRFEITAPTPLILMLRPRNTAHQWISRESYIIKPNVPVMEFIDEYGNHCQRLVAPPGQFIVRTSAVVQTERDILVSPGAPFDEIQNLPNSVLTYMLPSRYCESDRFVELAHQIVEDITPGYDQVAAINQWLQNNIAFNPDSPYFQMSAVEVNQAQQGVCRDLAHLGIALCRALCIPTRMVVGYLYGLEPMDLHAWFEAYVGGHWYTFDPTQPGPRGGRIVVAYGHDAADVAVFNQFGPALPPVSMSVAMELLNKAPE